MDDINSSSLLKRIIFILLIVISQNFLFALEDEKELGKQEEHFIHFRYGSDVAYTATKGGNYTSHATPHTPTEVQIKDGFVNIKNTLQEMKGSLTVADMLKIYASADEGGFHAVHSAIKEGYIDSKLLGKLRETFHQDVLQALAKKLDTKIGSLGVNDFGSEASGLGDIDFTLYAKKLGVDAQWLVKQYNSMFTKLAKSRYGVGVTPGQLDIVAHRYDATVPDWRAKESVADFEIKLRTGTTLLKSNPEAYFLEGAYLQQIMGRSTKLGEETFTWYKSGIKPIKVNAVTVSEFFYAPQMRKAWGFGGAVANLHFYYAHTDSLLARAKYLLRSLDDGAGLLVESKKGDYKNIRDVKERRKIIDDLYDSPQMKYTKELRNEIFETYEVCRKIRRAKDISWQLSDMQKFANLIEYHKNISLTPIDDVIALKLAKQTFKSTSGLILTSNVVRTIKQRARDWLRPNTLKERVGFEDENGNYISRKTNSQDLKKLQFSAFREMHDSIQILQQDKQQDIIERLKKQNPILKRDIEIVEGILKTKRKMMLAPKEVHPESALSYRQKAAQSVIESWKKIGSHEVGSTLWRKSIKNANDGWVTGQALESYLYTCLADSVVHISNFLTRSKIRPALEKLRISAANTNTNPILMTRISRANSLVYLLTLYIEEGDFNNKVLNAAILEGFSHVPFLGMPIDIKRGGAAGVSVIVLSQWIPGYGQFMLAVNTAKGVVNLGGTMLFTPLKNQRMKLAYQGYIDPVDISVKNPLYKFILEQTGTKLIRDTVAWWLYGTGKKERIYSPRPSVLYPIDPTMKMSLQERRKAVFKYFQPKVEVLIEKDLGLKGWSVQDDGYMATDPDLRESAYPNSEARNMPKVMNQHVEDWWDGKGVFASHDELAVKRMMDEYYGKEMRAKITYLLVLDYMAGKGEMVLESEREQKKLQELFSKAAAFDSKYDETYKENHASIKSAHKNVAIQTIGQLQEDVEHIKPRIEVTSSPKVIIKKDDKGNDIAVIEKLNIHAKIIASDTKEHPAPFRIGFEVKADSENKKLKENENFLFEFKPDKVPKSITVSVTVYDANSTVFHEHDLFIPIKEEKISSDEDNKSDQKSDGCKEKYLSELERLDKEIDSIKDFSDTTIGKCVAAKKVLDKLQVEIKLEKNVFSEIKSQINNLVKKMKNTEKAKELLEDNDQKIEKLATEIENILSDLGELSLKICQKTKTLNDYKINDDEHEKTFTWIQKNKRELKVYLKKVKERYKKIESYKNKIIDIIKELETVELKAMEMIEKSIQKMNTMSEKIDTVVAQVEGAIQENTINELRIYSRKLAVKKSLEKLSEKCGSELENEIKAFYARVKEIVLFKCSKEIKAQINSLKASSSKKKKEKVESTEKIDQTKKQFKEYTENIKNIQSLEKNREIILSLIKNYLLRAKRFAEDGALCVVLSEEIMKKVFIPKVTGMKFKDALGVLSDKGLNNVSSGKIKQTLSKDSESSVFNQHPEVKRRVKKETKIILDHYASYGDTVENIMAQKNCSKNTVKIWSEVLKEVDCVCPEGKEMSKKLGICVETADDNKTISKDENITLDQIMYRVSGRGYIPHWGGGSYVMPEIQHADFIFTLKEPGTEAYIQSIIDKKVEQLKSNPCDKGPCLWCGRKQAPHIWESGPYIEIIKGPTSGLTDDMREKTWNASDDDGPSLSELKEAAGCKK